MATAHRVAIFLTPILSLATLAVGMRIGAKRIVHAAVIEGAPRAHEASAFAWQVITMVADSGGRETEPRAGVTIHAHARTREGDRDATWRGDTNEDGVAEVRLELPGVERGDPIDLEVLGDGLSEPLAAGRAAWDDAAWMEAAPGPFLRTSKRAGAIALDVAILGGRLVARNDVPLLIRATSHEDGHPVENVIITPEPEPGLDVRQSAARTCALGWAALDVAPKIYVAALGLKAKVADGRTGEWFSGLPVATGTIHPLLPDSVQAGQMEPGPHPGQASPARQSAFEVQAQTGAYVEIDDSEGRAFGGWAKLPDASGNRASFAVPPLAPGLKWFVTSSEPRGAELPDEATILRPFLVLGAPMPPGSPPSDDPCALIAYLALHPAGGFHRSTLLDGFVSRKNTNSARRTRGLAIGLGSLGLGALLELLLLLQSARRGRALSPDGLEGAEEKAALVAVTKRSSSGSVIVGLLLALLGFGLIAALLLLKS